MKNKIINLLGIGILSCSLVVPVCQPIYAASETFVVSEESEKELSVLKIEAYNKTKGTYESNVSFKVIDRATGNLVSFSKDSSGRYTVDSKGYYQYLEPSNGYVQITGLNGSYTVEDTGNNSNLYCQSNSSNFSIADKESRTIKFEYVQNYGSLSITLLSEDDSTIADAKFVLKDSNGALVYFNNSNGVYTYAQNGSSSELVTNAAGRILLDELPAGTYTIEQTSAPVEYNGQLATKSIIVENQKQVSATLTNTKEYGNLIVNVVDLNDNSKALSGSEFTIQNSNGENIGVTKNTDGSYSFSRTSSETKISIENGSLSVSGLPKGTYVLTEKTSPTGYDAVGSKEFDIQTNNTTNLQIKNERSVGSLSISITDEETNDPIEGFVYQILSKETEEPIGFKETTDGYVYSVNGETELTTNSEGKIVLSNIPTGSYYVKQLKAASGYLLEINDVEQSISSDLETVYTTIASKSNSAIAIVNKEGKAISDVEFEILDSDKNVIISDKTNENGKYLISGIPAGTYTLKIKNVPETYAKYSDDISFSIDETGLSEGLARITLEYNQVTINLGKKDISVVLTNKKDKTTTSVKTDEKGIATFSKLKYGEYTISLEDKDIAFDDISFTVDENFDNTTYDVELTDNDTESATTTSDDKTKKTSNNVIIIIIALIIGVAFGVYAYFFRKKKKNAENTETDENNVHVGYDDDGNAVIYEEVEVDVPEETSENNTDSDIDSTEEITTESSDDDNEPDSSDKVNN